MAGVFTFARRTLIGLNVSLLVMSFLLIGVASYSKTSNIVASLPIIGGVTACGVFLMFLSVLGLIATAKHHQVLLFAYMIMLSIVFLIQFSVACACLAVDKQQEQSITQVAWSTMDSLQEYDTIHDAEKHFKCCGYDEKDPRRAPGTKDEDEWAREEQKWCIQKIGGCFLTPTTATSKSKTTDALTTAPTIATSVSAVTSKSDPTEAPLTTSTITAITNVDGSTTAASQPITPEAESNVTVSTTVAPKTTTDETPKSLACPICKDILSDRIKHAFSAAGGLGLFLALLEIIGVVVAYQYRNQPPEGAETPSTLFS